MKQQQEQVPVDNGATTRTSLQKGRTKKGKQTMNNAVMSKIDEVIGSANAELAEIVKGGFPFTFDEVKLTKDMDSAGIYIHCGTTPICSVVRAGNPWASVDAIRDAVRGEIDGIRVAVERRSGIRADAEALASEGENIAKAKAALVAAGVPTDVIKDGISDNVAKAVKSEITAAVKKANMEMHSQLGVTSDLCENIDFSVKSYHSGIVILVGGRKSNVEGKKVVTDAKEVIVTRYPKVSNNKSIEKMIAFIKADISSCGESRVRYFRRVRRMAEREAALREIAHRLDSAESALKAAATM